MNEIQLELHVDNFDTVKKFYGELGFEIVWERQPEGPKGYLVLRRSNTVIQFWSGNDEVYSQPHFRKFPRNTEKGYGVEIVIPVEDVENVYEHFKTRDNITEELTMQPWGVIDFRMTDPFGYYLRITQQHDITDSKFAVK